MSSEEEPIKPPSYIAATREEAPPPKEIDVEGMVEALASQVPGEILPPKVEITAPSASTPQEISTTMEVLDKAIETERNVELEFTQVVDKVQIPEIAAILDDISKQALVNQQKLTEIRKLATSESKALTSEPVDLNTCFNKAMGMARTMYGAYERLTVDPLELKEQIKMEKSATGKAALEGQVGDLTKRAKDTLSAVRNEVRDTPCLLIRDKVHKMGEIDHALELIDAGAIDLAAEVIRGF